MSEFVSFQGIKTPERAHRKRLPPWDAHDGAGIEADVEELCGGKRLDDHGLDSAPDGLSIWEGCLSASKDYWTGEMDYELVGAFRELTDHEWDLYRVTGEPWEYECAGGE